jgi:enoyl-CoA hydratase/carnithine racemase
LIAEVVETGTSKERALQITETIGQEPPRSIELAKASILAAYQTSLDAEVEFERQSIRNAFTTADQRKGMSAFLEKRPSALCRSLTHAGRRSHTHLLVPAAVDRLKAAQYCR